VQVAASASSEDLQQLNSGLSAWLDEQEEAGAPDLPGGMFDLIVSTPGASDTLTTDNEFEVFKGFDVVVRTREPVKGKTIFEGSLHSRDEEWVRINKMGRIVKLPREAVDTVVLPKAKDGDRAGADI